VDYRSNFVRVMASGFFHEYRRRLDSRTAGHCAHYSCFQLNQWQAFFGLISSLGISKVNRGVFKNEQAAFPAVVYGIEKEEKGFYV